MVSSDTDLQDGAVYRYRFSDVEYSEADGCLHVSGVAVPLERRPLAVLGLLLRQPGIVLTKKELLTSLWGRDEATLSDNALANAISKLRDALGPAGSSIKNVRGVGYRLDTILERTVLSRPAPSPLALSAGMPVPHRPSYRLERPLGRSAHSEVWLATQPRTADSRVFKFCTDAERLSALKREYTLHRLLLQSLGERPEFTRVIDANFSDAPYWLECDYGGEDLIAWSEHEPHFGGLDRAQRLALFLGVARSVALAHAVGVLHKDLKPANVLVAPAGHGGWLTRLTDFGSGRVLDRASLEAMGVTAMGLTLTEGITSDSGSATLFYLAPEVLGGAPPTVQSDLYALGLMLFQLLVGDFRRPMAPGWEEEIDDPLLREDLAAATQSQPAARLQTVSEWVDRLARLDERREERVLQATAARTAADSVARWQRSRARRPFVIGAFACLALGLGASLWFYGQARDALGQAEAESRRAISINDFLNKDVLQSADVSRAGSTRQVSMVDVLQRASARAEQRFRGQPLVEVGVRQQLAQIYQNMGSLALAEQEVDRALSMLAPHAAPGDDRLSALQLSKVRLLALRTSLDEAEALLVAVEKTLGPRRLAANDEMAYLGAQARFAVLALKQRMTESAPFGERALLLLERLFPADLPAQAAMRRELADIYNRLSRHDRAMALLEVALKPPFTAATIGEASLERGRITLARIQIASGKGASAEASLIQARDTLMRTFGPTDYTAALATAELANLYTERGDFAKARTESELALKTLMASVGPEHQATRTGSLNLALNLLQLGKSEPALQRLTDDRAWFVRKFGSERAPVVQGIDYYRAQALTDLGRPALALRLLEPLDADSLAQASPATDWRHRLTGQRGRALVALGRRGEGRPLLEQAIAGMEREKTAPWMMAPMREAMKAPAASRDGAPQRSTAP